MQATYRDRHHDILYQNTPTSRICLPSVGRFAEVPCRRVAVYTKQVPRYHWDTKNIPSNVRGQVQRATKRELERYVNDIQGHPTTIFGKLSVRKTI